MSNLVGTVLGGRFNITRVIGEGGMGTVYEATHQTLPRKFALKILRPELARQRTFVERFRREAIAASRVEHPNVIHITDFGVAGDGLVYLAMEYLEGVGLDEVIGRHTRLPVNRALGILLQVVDALDHAHRMNVVHRDLKPENILLTDVRGQRDFVKILDFGIAKLREPEFDAAALTMEGQVFGTAEYMSPEQATGEPIDGRADLYAVGCLACEMLTGDPPFVGPPVDVLRAHVGKAPVAPSSRLAAHRIPTALDALVLRCLAKEPRDRYATGKELKRDLLKVRAILLQLTQSMVHGEPAAAGAATEDQRPSSEMTGGWRGLGGKIPSFLQGPVVELDEVAPPIASSTSELDDALDPEQLRAQYCDVLRQLALGLADAGIAAHDTSAVLARLLTVEEEIDSLTGTIALAEQGFDSIRFEYGQQEKRLRYAILDLRMEQAKLQGLATASPADAPSLLGEVSDLAFQINALEGRSREVETERGQQIHELDLEVKRYRNARKQREDESSTIFQGLHVQVESVRTRVMSDALAALYHELDSLRLSIDHASS